jgi:hypothetical protein
MNPERLAEGINELLIDDALNSYKEMYVSSELPDIPTEYQQDIFNVLSALDSDAKHSFYRLIDNVLNDTVTSFCAFLDGSCGYVGQDSGLLLYSEDNKNEPLNGDLMMYLDRARGL